MLQAHIPGGPFWHVLTRLGEAQILLPATLALLLWLAFHPAARLLASWWVAMLVLAAGITTLSKVAFIGFGIGVPELNFTGVSGHAMFAAVVYPPLFGAMASSRSLAWQRGAVSAGFGLALLVGISRVMVDAHSVSEVAAGLALGGGASAAALGIGHVPAVRLPIWIPLAVAAWLLVTPASAPPSRTHDMVTQLSLAVSGRSAPYTRRDMLRDWHQRIQTQLQERHTAANAATAT